MSRYLLFLGLLLTLVSCKEALEKPVEYTGKTQPAQILLNDHLLTLQDSVDILTYAALLPGGKDSLTYKEVVDRHRSGDFRAPGTYPILIEDKKAYWLTFTIANPDTFARSYVLYFGHEQYLELYGLEEEALLGNLVPARKKEGAFLPGFYVRDEGHSAQVFLQMRPQESREFYLKIRRVINKPMPLELKIFHPDFWKQRINPAWRHLGQAFFQGIIWALLLYHLLLFLMIRDITYLHYCLYILLISFLTLGDFGYLQAYLLKDQPYLAWCLFLWMQYATGIMTFKFMQSFVQLKKLLPVWNRRVNLFIKVNVVILGLVSVLYLITQNYGVVQLTQPLLIPFALAGLLMCYLLIRTQDQVALYFAIAGIIFGLAVMTNGALELLSRKDQLLESPYYRYYLLEITAIIHLFTFSIGLGYRRRKKDLENQRTLEMDRIKSHFYANITHEFRTPLTVIMGLSDQLEVYPREQRLIRRNGRHLLRLINQLLDLSKLESGKLHLDLVQGDMVGYLRYLTESFHSMATDKDIQLTFYSEEDVLRMDYDENRIQHIIYNLLSNAIKFTPKKGKVILHLVRKERAGQVFAQIKVKDTGAGIPVEQLPFIFDRFYQVDGSSTRREEGTGIGLSLTRELVHLMSGKITVNSTLRKGSEFVVAIPISNRAPLASQIPEMSHLAADLPALERPERSTTNGGVDGPILLLIEDNADLQTYICDLLQDTYLIHTADDGQKGIDLALELVPDIIISDVMMPEKNGYEVCRTIKQDERTSHIPIILLTAKAGQRDKVEGLRYGADAYLTKPFDQEELFVRLEKLIELRQELQRTLTLEPLSTDAPAESQPEAAFLQKLRLVIAEHMDNPDFGVSHLAVAVNRSPTQLYRKLKALTDKTPSQFIRSARLQKGRVLLETTDLNVSEIAYEVGFSDPNYFSRTFLQEFKTSPSDFRR